MRTISLQQKVLESEPSLPPKELFWRIGDLTALRQDSAGRFYRSNYERGLLLYSLVARYRPRTILEFGTGRGYGSICMAWSLVEHGIDGRVYTIDRIASDEKQSWWIDSGSGPRAEMLSLAEVWPSHFDRPWLDRITCLNGDSTQVMAAWTKKRLPRVDLAFIDGGHRYQVVKHDFYSVLSVASPRFQVLFDDYVEKESFGVHKFVDDEVAPLFELEALLADSSESRRASTPIRRCRAWPCSTASGQGSTGIEFLLPLR